MCVCVRIHCCLWLCQRHIHTYVQHMYKDTYIHMYNTCIKTHTYICTAHVQWLMLLPRFYLLINWIYHVFLRVHMYTVHLNYTHNFLIIFVHSSYVTIPAIVTAILIIIEGRETAFSTVVSTSLLLGNRWKTWNWSSIIMRMAICIKTKGFRTCVHT